MSVTYMTFEGVAAGYAVDVRFHYSPDEVVAELRGEIDAQSDEQYAAVLDAGLAGRTNVVLDVAGLEFCGAAGMRVIAGLAQRCNDAGGRVVVRSASPLFTRLLEVTDVGALVTTSVGSPSIPARTEQLTDELSGTVAALAYDAIVDALMTMLTTLAPAIMALEAASVTMRDDKQFVTVAASDAAAVELDETQYSQGAGPCVDAATHGLAVQFQSTDETAELQLFREAAMQAGIRAVLSTPLLRGAEPIGALNLYSSNDDFAARERKVATLMTREAAALLSSQHPQHGALVERIHDALANRDLIARAQGILMERDNLSADAGYLQLRQESRESAEPLRERAARVVASKSDNGPGGDCKHP